MQVIEILVAPSGEVKLQTRGFHGSECRDATKLLEAALGITTDDVTTSEFYNQSANHNLQRESN